VTQGSRHYIQAVIINDLSNGIFRSFGLACNGVGNYNLTEKEKKFAKDSLFNDLNAYRFQLYSFNISSFDSPYIYLTTKLKDINILCMINKTDLIIAQKELPDFILKLQKGLTLSDEDKIDYLINEIFRGRKIECDGCSTECVPRYITELNKFESQLDDEKEKIQLLNIIELAS
jgi:hypothetical protein